MPMTKKHYVADAAAINRVLYTPDSDPVTIARVVAAMCDVRRKDNERFDKVRFIEACFQEEGKR